MTAWIPSGNIPLVLLVQGTAYLAAGLTASYLLRRHAARAHRVLLACMTAALLVPATYMLVRHLGWGLLTPPSSAPLPVVIDAAPDAPAIDLTALDEGLFQMAEFDLEESATFIPPEEPPAREIPWTAIVLSGWVIFSVLFWARLLLRLILGIRLIHLAKPVSAKPLCEALQQTKDRLGLGGEVDLRSSRNVCSPVIWCWRRIPVLLVHESASTAAKCDWTGVFCHELAHWKRRDHISGLLAEVLTALLPWHPLTWWAKGRLARLSEEACDDWVIAGGHTGIDYAESLLDLTPQGQPAFLPTVVGKERTMKARISRIVSDKCSNPIVGKRWALGLGILIVCVAAGLALAQPGVAPREVPTVAQPARNPDLAATGRRNVLERMLRQLRGQAQSTQMALAERGDQPGEERQILRAELDTLNNQIARIERQLAAPELPPAQPVAATPPVARRVPPAQPVATAPPATRRTAVAQTRATRTASQPQMPAGNERLNDLRAQARRIQGLLSELDDPDGSRAEALRDALAQTEEEIRDIQAEQIRQRDAAVIARDQARRQRVQGTIDALGQQSSAMRVQGPVARAAAPRRNASDRGLPELLQTREILQSEIAAAEHDLAQLGDADSKERLERQSFLEQLHLQARMLDLQIAQTETAVSRRPGLDRPLEAEVDELRGQVNGLSEQMQQMQNLLEQLVATQQRQAIENRDPNPSRR